MIGKWAPGQSQPHPLGVEISRPAPVIVGFGGQAVAIGPAAQDRAAGGLVGLLLSSLAAVLEGDKAQRAFDRAALARSCQKPTRRWVPCASVLSEPTFQQACTATRKPFARACAFSGWAGRLRGRRRLVDRIRPRPRRWHRPAGRGRAPDSGLRVGSARSRLFASGTGSGSGGGRPRSRPVRARRPRRRPDRRDRPKRATPEGVFRPPGYDLRSLPPRGRISVRLRHGLRRFGWPASSPPRGGTLTSSLARRAERGAMRSPGAPSGARLARSGAPDGGAAARMVCGASRPAGFGSGCRFGPPVRARVRAQAPVRGSGSGFGLRAPVRAQLQVSAQAPGSGWARFPRGGRCATGSGHRLELRRFDRSARGQPPKSGRTCRETSSRRSPPKGQRGMDPP